MENACPTACRAARTHWSTTLLYLLLLMLLAGSSPNLAQASPAIALVGSPADALVSLAGGHRSPAMSGNAGPGQLTRLPALVTSAGLSEYLGFNYYVNSVVVQADGKLLVGGDFTTYQGQSANYLIRLNADNSRDASFRTGLGFNNYVKTVAMQPDGKLLVGGFFTTYQGQAAVGLMRLNADGSRDKSFTTGADFSSYVTSVAVQADGQLLVAGRFKNLTGFDCLIRLNADGSRDTSFNMYQWGFNGEVRCLLVQADGRLLVGGDFTTHQGAAARYLVRLHADGRRDPTFTPDAGFNGSVKTVAMQADGKLLVGGGFSTYQNTVARYLVRLNPDGSRDPTLMTGSMSFNSSVASVAVLADGQLLVAGYFDSYQGNVVGNLVRLHADGRRVGEVAPGTGFDGSVHTVVVQADGHLLVGGGFGTYQGTAANGLARLRPDGRLSIPATPADRPALATGPGFNNYVQSVVVQADGKLLVGGYFRSYQGQAANSLVRLHADGRRDTTFVIGTGFDGSVLGMVLLANGKLLVGGGFSTYQDTMVNCLVRLDTNGRRDPTLLTGKGFGGGIASIAVQADDKLVVGGFLTYYQDTTANYLIRLHASGRRDPTFATGTGFNEYVNSVAVQADGRVLVGGTFTTYRSKKANRLVRLHANGLRDAGFALGQGLNHDVNSVAVQADGRVLVGGAFTAYQGQPANHLIRLKANGRRDPGFATGTGFNGDVQCVVVQADGKLLVGGDFTTYQGTMAKYFVRLNADGSRDPAFTTGL